MAKKKELEQIEFKEASSAKLQAINEWQWEQIENSMAGGYNALGRKNRRTKKG